nr:MAG: L1 protein [Betta papillomavirus 1]
MCTIFLISVYSAGTVPVALEYTEGGVPTEPYIKSTDEFVTETDITFIVKSDPIRLQGHPYKDISKSDGNPKIPMCSPARFNVVELALPDLNKLIMPPLPGKLSLSTQVFVWKLVGFRIDIQGPECGAVTGCYQSTLSVSDAGEENGKMPSALRNTDGLSTCMCSFSDVEDNDEKQITWGLEHAQRQVICVGCKPLKGYNEQWDDSSAQTYMYKRHTMEIQDGYLCEFGYGNYDANHEGDKTVIPVEMQDPEDHPTLCVDKMSMDNDNMGDSCFLMLERQADGVRHLTTNGSDDAEGAKAGDDDPNFANVTHSADPFIAKTAGMISSLQDIFNKNYWLGKCRGVNNGIIWGNKLYITFADNTRGFIYRHTQKTSNQNGQYTPGQYKYRLRHVKEFQVQVIVRKCAVKLEAKLITALLQFNKDWLNNLGFKFNASPELNLNTTGVFRNLMQTEEEAEADTEPPVINAIKIDCNGSATMQHSHHSHALLAKSFHANAPKVAAVTPPPRNIKRKS